MSCSSRFTDNTFYSIVISAQLTTHVNAAWSRSPQPEKGGGLSVGLSSGVEEDQGKNFQSQPGFFSSEKHLESEEYQHHHEALQKQGPEHSGAESWKMTIAHKL